MGNLGGMYRGGVLVEPMTHIPNQRPPTLADILAVGGVSYS